MSDPRADLDHWSRGSGHASRRTIRTLVLAAALTCPFACADSESERDSAAHSAADSQAAGSEAATDVQLARSGEGDAPSRPNFEGQQFSPNASPDIHRMLQEEKELPRHPSDGQGEGFLDRIENLRGEPIDDSVVAGSRARFHLRYRAGPLGVAENGYVFIQASPFWRWDSPQFEAEDAPGYTTVRTDVAGLDFERTSFGEGLAAVRLVDRGLDPGQELHFVYGAGPSGARADDYAEREAHIWFMVDGDGDGYRRLVDASPTLTMLPSIPGQLVLTLPTTAAPGQTVVLNAAVLDIVASRGVEVAGTLRLDLPDGIEGPSEIRFEKSDAGVKQISLETKQAGIFRIDGRFEADQLAALRANASGDWKDEAPTEPIEALAGPLVVGRIAPVLWADLHGHTSLSDGTGTPEDYFRYAREVAALDVVALTDHDHWGMRMLDERPGLWTRIKKAVAAAHDPGRFVALLGYEWTSWIHGHRHVVYFEDEVESGTIFSSVDPETENPDQLWAALRGRQALTFAHHSAGGPVGTNWSYVPDPILEPVTEIVSIHGSSEGGQTPDPIYNFVPGNTVRDALDAGYRLGLIGSGDSHDGHPGLAHLGAPSQTAGLAALVGAEHTRSSTLDALRKRSVYATNGARIWMRVSLDGEPMGTLLTQPEGSADGERSSELEVAVAGTGALESLEVVRSDGIGRVQLQGELEWSGTLELPALEEGQYLYVRAVQEDGKAAWSSPFFCCEP